MEATAITLTPKQEEIEQYLALGYAAKEIAEYTGNTPNTINTHVRNIKESSKWQKSSEIIADYWCRVFGTTLEEQRKRMISTITLLALLFNVPSGLDDYDKLRRPFIRSRREVEITVNNHSII